MAIGISDGLMTRGCNGATFLSLRCPHSRSGPSRPCVIDLWSLCDSFSAGGYQRLFEAYAVLVSALHPTIDNAGLQHAHARSQGANIDLHSASRPTRSRQVPTASEEESGGHVGASQFRKRATYTHTHTHTHSLECHDGPRPPPLFRRSSTQRPMPLLRTCLSCSRHGRHGMTCTTYATP
ncbi:hypothetical protein LZ30DRAFT_402416 [Colletotrichum cereale]|nr:hypothetical protein LZ30DRAFT_402416 [Colletotrichum cereale]